MFNALHFFTSSSSDVIVVILAVLLLVVVATNRCCVKNCGASVKVLWHKEAYARWVSILHTMVHLLNILNIHWYIYYTYKYYYTYYTGTHATLVQTLLLEYRTHSAMHKRKYIHQ